MSDIRTQRRRPKEWQLAVLKTLQSESGIPTEEQLSAAAAETGLDEKWVKNWFTRQRSRLATRNRMGHGTDSAIVPAFKLQLCYPPAAPGDLASRGSVSTSADPTPNSPAKLGHRRSPAALDSRSPRPFRLAVNAGAIPRSHRSVSAPVNTALFPHTATIPTYSRDPLCNRYPDFSQFFCPRGHERPHTFQLSAPIDSHSRLMQPLAMDSHTPMHFQGLSILLNPLQLSGLSTNPSASTYLRPCPVAFSVRLVDLLGCP